MLELEQGAKEDGSRHGAEEIALALAGKLQGLCVGLVGQVHTARGE